MGAEQGLSKEQTGAFWRQGFLVVDDVFSAEEVEELRQAAASEAIVGPQQQRGYAEKAVHLLELTVRHPRFKALAADERIVAKLRSLIGDDIQLQHSKIATKPPVKDRGAYKMHQDFAFFPHTNTDLVAVMVMLDDATPENGCMKMAPGSHRWGLLDHLEDGVFTGGCTDTARWDDGVELVDITPKAGGISLHHCLALHGSENNQSGRPRRGLVFQYRADDAFQLADTVFADTGLLVSGQRRAKVRCQEGVWTLPKRRDGTGYGSAWNQVGSEVALE